MTKRVIYVFINAILDTDHEREEEPIWERQP
jgi:hypothetical protein